MGLNILVSTGEVSGDLISSYLVKSLLQRCPDLDIVAVGGPKVQQAGARLIFNSFSIGAMGIIEALPMIWRVLCLRRAVFQQVRRQRPDLVVLVDCNGFNSSLAARFKKMGIPTVCFIPPQDWVFDKVSSLMRTLIRCCTRIVSIFPKEHEFYSALGARSVWLGHPLVDIVKDVPNKQAAREGLGLPLKATVVTLLPLSRRQEIRYILPKVLQAAALIQREMPSVHFCMPVVREDLMPEIERVCAQADLNHFHLLRGSNRCAIAAADVVLSKSGTVNLETALIGTPQVVFYILNRVTFWLGVNVLRLPLPHFISPVNLIAMRPVVPEFVQKKASSKVLAQTVLSILNSTLSEQRFEQGYSIVRSQFGEPGSINRFAGLITDLMHGAPQRQEKKESV